MYKMVIKCRRAWLENSHKIDEAIRKEGSNDDETHPRIVCSTAATATDLP